MILMKQLHLSTLATNVTKAYNTFFSQRDRRESIRNAQMMRRTR